MSSSTSHKSSFDAINWFSFYEKEVGPKGDTLVSRGRPLFVTLKTKRDLGPAVVRKNHTPKLYFSGTSKDGPQRVRGVETKIENPR